MRRPRQVSREVTVQADVLPPVAIFASTDGGRSRGRSVPVVGYSPKHRSTSRENAWDVQSPRSPRSPLSPSSPGTRLDRLRSSAVQRPSSKSGFADTSSPSQVPAISSTSDVPLDPYSKSKQKSSSGVVNQSASPRVVKVPPKEVAESARPGASLSGLKLVAVRSRPGDNADEVEGDAIEPVRIAPVASRMQAETASRQFPRDGLEPVPAAATLSLSREAQPCGIGMASKVCRCSDDKGVEDSDLSRPDQDGLREDTVELVQSMYSQGLIAETVEKDFDDLALHHEFAFAVRQWRDAGNYSAPLVLNKMITDEGSFLGERTSYSTETQTTVSKTQTTVSKVSAFSAPHALESQEESRCRTSSQELQLRLLSWMQSLGTGHSPENSSSSRHHHVGMLMVHLQTVHDMMQGLSLLFVWKVPKSAVTPAAPLQPALDALRGMWQLAEDSNSRFSTPDPRSRAGSKDSPTDRSEELVVTSCTVALSSCLTQLEIHHCHEIKITQVAEIRDVLVGLSRASGCMNPRKSQPSGDGSTNPSKSAVGDERCVVLKLPHDQEIILRFPQLSRVKPFVAAMQSLIALGAGGTRACPSSPHCQADYVLPPNLSKALDAASDAYAQDEATALATPKRTNSSATGSGCGSPRGISSMSSNTWTPYVARTSTALLEETTFRSMDLEWS